MWGGKGRQRVCGKSSNRCGCVSVYKHRGSDGDRGTYGERYEEEGERVDDPACHLVLLGLTLKTPMISGKEWREGGSRLMQGPQKCLKDTEVAVVVTTQ